ncbi:MAG: hypothetical protein J1E81_09705 [Eubacterium sp.]|nr:hypothetical protein [Eubacterium sp.]
MTTVFLNADFISLNEKNDIYSVMVTHGKLIEHIGFATPLCYDDKKVVDLNGMTVVPLICDKVGTEYKHAHCTVLASGEQADFAVFDKNPYKFDDAQLVSVYVKAKLKS